MFESFQPKVLHSAYEAYVTPKGRDTLARKCRAKVVEWRWATGDMSFADSLRKPFVKEMNRRAPKWLKAAAVPKYGNVRHGLDGQGVIHVVVDPSFGEREMNEEQGAWTYLIYGAGQIEAITYRYTPGRLEHLRRCLYDGERLIREHAMMRGGRGAETHYLWDGARLDRQIAMSWNESFDSGSRSWKGFEATSHTETRFHYDALGRLQRIVERYLNKNGTLCKGIGPQLIYERPEKAETIPHLNLEIERLLLEQVPAAVAQARGKGPFYGLLLCYCGEDFPAGWPPFLLLVSEAERQRAIQRGQDVKYYLWAPGEMEARKANLRLNLKDEILNNYCRLHIQLMDARRPDDPATQQEKTYAPAKKVLRNVAKALNQVQWSKIIEVTPDFLVAAVDDHGETDPAEDIKAVISPAKFRALREKGLI